MGIRDHSQCVGNMILSIAWRVGVISLLLLSSWRGWQWPHGNNDSLGRLAIRLVGRERVRSNRLESFRGLQLPLLPLLPLLLQQLPLLLPLQG